MGNHTHQLFPDSCLPRPNHSGSRIAQVPQTRTPNSDHSTERRPRPWSLLSRGHPAGSDLSLLPWLEETRGLELWLVQLVLAPGLSLEMSGVTSRYTQACHEPCHD